MYGAAAEEGPAFIEMNAVVRHAVSGLCNSPGGRFLPEA